MKSELICAQEASGSGRWRTSDPREEARAKLQREAFRLTHSLAGHPQFALEELMKVSQEASRRQYDLYFDAGDVSISDKWGHIPLPRCPVSEILDRIENAGAWIIIKHVER